MSFLWMPRNCAPTTGCALNLSPHEREARRCREAEISSETEAAATARSVPNRQVARLFDVPVVVDEERCIKGCHICVESCPVDCLAIAPATGKSHMKYDDCWYCLACEVDCPTNAITEKIPYLIR